MLCKRDNAHVSVHCKCDRSEEWKLCDVNMGMNVCGSSEHIFLCVADCMGINTLRGQSADMCQVGKVSE